MSFLNAEWRKLILANYAVEPELLKDYIPAGTSLDFWEGKCFISLVGFMFINTRLLGMKIPFHINFEEVNLRFYVRRHDNGELKRGVVFIKEIVPRPAITFVANNLYNEHYETLPMGHEWKNDGENVSAEYRWKKSGRWNQFRVTGENRPEPLESNSITEFITEHYWGYARINNTSSNEYEVKHPAWMTYPVTDFKIDVDFGEVYGRRFEFLGRLQPDSVMFAEGSPISVESKKKVRIH